MMLDELWATLSGVSGAALACCFVATAVALRWSARRKARGAVIRARLKQKAALESMDKAAQRFRLQVMAGAEIGSPGRHQVGVSLVALFSCLDAWRGRWQAAQACNFRNPSLP